METDSGNTGGPAAGGPPPMSAGEYESAFNLCPDLLAVADARGTLLAVNPACTRILGYLPEEMVGASWASFVHPDDVATTQRQVAGQLRGASVAGFVNRFRAKDGGFRMLQWHGCVTESRVLVGAARDVSDQARHDALLASVAESQRKKVCFDLHDGIGQQLVALRMLANQLRKDLADVQPDLAMRAANIEQVAGETLASLREVMEGLMPIGDRPENLVEALQRLAERVSRLHAIQCPVACDTLPGRLRPGSASQLFLIAQESVMNAVRHAKPKQIDIVLEQRGSRLWLEVSDDGCGLPVQHADAGRGLGLGIMRDRAALIGAAFEICSCGRKGTTVRCSLPLPEADDGVDRHDQQLQPGADQQKGLEKAPVAEKEPDDAGQPQPEPGAGGGVKG